MSPVVAAAGVANAARSYAPCNEVITAAMLPTVSATRASPE
jgi:hypothetical protein